LQTAAAIVANNQIQRSFSNNLPEIACSSQMTASQKFARLSSLWSGAVASDHMLRPHSLAQALDDFD
jgi:hypothetical protein